MTKSPEYVNRLRPGFRERSEYSLGRGEMGMGRRTFKKRKLVIAPAEFLACYLARHAHPFNMSQPYRVETEELFFLVLFGKKERKRWGVFGSFYARGHFVGIALLYGNSAGPIPIV